MKYNLLLAALLSASTLFSVETIQETQIEALPPISADQPYTGEHQTAQYAVVEHQHQAPAVVEAPRQAVYQQVQRPAPQPSEPVLAQRENMLITVIGQGVAPVNTSSPAQAYALAKRAAVADAYRMIAEKVKGVRIDGQDLIKNMMIKRSTVRTSVRAMVRNANVVETTFKEGLCEVEMEITLSHSDFAQ